MPKPVKGRRPRRRRAGAGMLPGAVDMTAPRLHGGLAMSPRAVSMFSHTFQESKAGSDAGRCVPRERRMKTANAASGKRSPLTPPSIVLARWLGGLCCLPDCSGLLSPACPLHFPSDCGSLSEPRPYLSCAAYWRSRKGAVWRPPVCGSFGLKGLADFPRRPSCSIAGGSLAADSGPGNGCSDSL